LYPARRANTDCRKSPTRYIDHSGIGGANERGSKRQWLFDRVEWQSVRLRSDLERCVRFADEGAAIIAELAAVASGEVRWLAI